VEAYGHSPGFGYKGETCEPQSVLVTGVRPVSLWPLITDSNCYHHNLAGPEGGPRARWAQKINVINL
jgi:hypothetical protein